MPLDILLQQLINGLALGSIYGLVAIGYTMVYGVIGMINFAHGDIYMIGAYAGAMAIAILTSAGVNMVPVALLLAFLFAIAVASLHNWAADRIAYRPLRGSSRLAPLISAIGVSLILQNYVQITQGARPQSMPPLISGVVRFQHSDGFVQVTHIQILVMLVAAASMSALTLFIGRTRLGRQCRALNQDRAMAAILGIPVDRTISLVFVMGAAMAAIAAILVTLNYGAFDFYAGFIIGIKAFTAAVLGGIGSLPGAMLGGIVLGLSESLFSGFASAEYKDAFAFSILVAVLVFRPSGLLGRLQVEKV